MQLRLVVNFNITIDVVCKYILYKCGSIYAGKESSIFELSDFIQAHENDLVRENNAGGSKVIKLNLCLSMENFSG